MTDYLKITFEYPMYEDFSISKGGNLSDFDKKSHALMHYYLHCQKLLERAGDNIEDQRFRLYEGELWMDKPYGQIALATAIRYGLSDPGEFLTEVCKQAVERECVRQGFPQPSQQYWDVEPGKVVRV